jgi:hypothetical protein
MKTEEGLCRRCGKPWRPNDIGYCVHCAKRALGALKRAWRESITHRTEECSACNGRFSIRHFGATLENDFRTPFSECRKCRKAKRVKRSWLKRYGLTVEKYEEILSRQKGKCAVCGRSFSETVTPCVDHCHKTNVVRGILCPQCNAAEGFLKTVKNARSLFIYMEANELFYGTSGK